MERWIAGRFGTQAAAGESADGVEVRVMARTGAYLYAAGASLALLWLALPHPAASNDLVLVGVLACAYLGAATLWYRGDRIPRAWYQAVVAAGTVMISCAVHFSGHSTPFVLFYLWGNVYAWYFFRRGLAALQLALIGVAYGAILATADFTAPEGTRGGLVPVLGPGAARWLITIGTLLVAGFLVATLRERVGRLIRGLTEERNFVSSVVDTAASLVVVFGLDGRLLSLNRACRDVTGYDSDEIRGSHISEFLLVPEELERAREEWERVVAGERAEFEAHVVARGGERRLIAWSVVLGRDASGAPDHVVATGADVTEHRRTEHELERRALRQAAVAELGRSGLEGVPLPLLVARSAEVIAKHLGLDHSQVWERTPYSGDLVLSAAVGLGEDEVGRLTVPADKQSQPGFTLSAEAPVIVEDFAGEERFSPPFGEAGAELASGLSVAIPGPRKTYGVIGGQTSEPRTFARDDALFLQSVAHVLGAAIERWRSEEAIRHNALHDPLTGLPNRALFLDRLTRVLARREPRGPRAAVMFLDVDNFKLINDSLGHDAGDRLLRAIGSRLTEALRPADSVARFGGDEFVVLCEDVADGRDALVVADRLQQALAAPFDVAEEAHFLTASIGVALVTGRYEGPDEVMRDADAAMYRAKRRGRAQCELFDDAMRNQVRGRLRMENALRGVIERDELRAYYQPIVSLEDGSLVGLEALMRWHHEGLGPVSPIEFIPIAEDTGLIVPLGAWMLEEVCRQISDWQSELGIEVPPVSVNLSPRQVAHAEIVPTVARVLRESGLDASQLALEITENVLIEEAESPWNTLQALKRLGVRLMLDDFGTGYSSLSWLKRFPVDALKIDRSFVDGLGCEAEDSAIVKAVVGMARALDLGVVAEGVETERQVECLRELGCPRAQGFLFGRPMTAADMTARLRPADPLGVVPPAGVTRA